MKHLQNFLLILAFIPHHLLSQDNGQNYIRSRTMLDESDATRYIETIQYYDGLGRPFMNVQKGITPTHSNLVSLQEYDEFGRESKSWLPLATTSDYITPDVFKTTVINFYNGDSRPFNEPVYEASPLNRIVKQNGAGYDWENHPVSTSYLTNEPTVSLQCKKYTISPSGSLIQNGEYNTGELYVTKTLDEDGRHSYTFTDKQQRQVLFRQIDGTRIPNDTYYVYDDFGNRCFILPPAYRSTPNLDLYAYQYKYDYRNRCIEKKLPGCEPIWYVYDSADKLIYSQTGNQRSKKEWTFFLYDALERFVITGTSRIDYVNTQEQLANICKNTVFQTSFTGNCPSEADKKENCFGYSNPLAGFGREIKVLSVSYYDTYDFLSLPCFTSYNLNYVEDTAFGIKHDSAKGLLTGSYIRQLDDLSKGEFAAHYYDLKGREIQKRSTSLPNGHYNYTWTKFNFTGKPTHVKKQHISCYYNNIYPPSNPQGVNHQKEFYEFEYDHAGRLAKTYHTHNDGRRVLLSESAFDQLGRLQEKKRHNGQDAIQYAYNIRNWITSIKGDGFEQELFYNFPSFPGVTQCFNGNISAIIYRQNGSESDFSFSYDRLNRLKSAKYFDRLENTNRDFETYEYDKMGNITSLVRNLNNNATDGLIFYYTGNQIKSVSNSNPASGTGFGIMSYPDMADRETEYFYDANGNLCKNLDKEIVASRYNSLNLPDTIQFQNGNQIINSYLADGRKVRTAYKTYMTSIVVPLDSVYHGNDINTLSFDEWSENYMYQRASRSYYPTPEMFMIQTPEGYIGADHIGIDSRRNYAYYYYIHDHLGNVRITRNSQGYYEDQSLEYYPSGVLFSRSENMDRQPYMFGGKELISMHGLNEFDFTARMQDPIISRFTSVDPLCEKFPWMSTYAYCSNNAVNRVDPNGMADFWYNGKVIGNDGISDQRILAIKTTEKSFESSTDKVAGAGLSKKDQKATINFIKANSGNAEAFQNNGIAYTNSIAIESSADNRQTMVDVVSTDNGKGGIANENNREYGGSIQNGTVITATAGDVASPAIQSSASITLPASVTTFHSHPSGTVVNAPPTGVIGGTTTTFSFNQFPSSVDIKNAGGNTHYVFGRGDSKVYIYNSNGIQAVIPLKQFNNSK